MTRPRNQCAIGPNMSLAAEEPVGRPVDELARQIIELTFRFRRLADPDDPCGEQPCETCYAVHHDRVRRYLERGQPVHFRLPAFPAKSRNPGKVIGALPDLGERISVEFLQPFCEMVSHVHAPGARILICTDGHVFADIGIPDDDVTAYRAELQRIIDTLGTDSIGLYSLDDAFGLDSYDDMRAVLVERYGIPLEELRQEVRHDLQARAMFNGMHRFMVEDHVPLTQGTSRSQVSKACKELAYQMIQRSRAWGDLVGDLFPDSLRLSIHPQHAHAGKIGFHLIRTRDNWLTPWHGVIVDDGQSVTLMKRSQAESANASLVWRHGRPSHYVHIRPEENAS